MEKQGGENPLIHGEQAQMKQLSAKTRPFAAVRSGGMRAMLIAVFAATAAFTPPAMAQDPVGANSAEAKPQKTVISRDFIKDSAIYYGSIWAFRFFYVRNKNARIYDTSLSKWWDNIARAPVTDDGDEFFTNYVVHPFAGYVSYLYYRQMGYGFWGSALGSALQSAMFEYTVEGLVETPSLPDLISTPALGVLVGAAAEKTSDWLAGMGNPVATFLAHGLNPMRNFVKDGRVVLINPLRRSFEYSQSFDTSNLPHKRRAVEEPQPHSFRSALPRGYAGARLEVAARKDAPGQIILYNIGAEMPSEDYGKSAYVFFNQSGVNNLGGDHARDGYELSNFTAGGKFLLAKTSSYWAALGIEAHLPTVYKDNVNRLETITSLYKRNLPVYVEDAWSVAPFAGAAVRAGPVSLEAHTSVVFLRKAEKFEGDGSETILRYGAALGVSLPRSLRVSAEITGNRIASSLENGRKSNAYFTAGLRFGGFVSPSVAVQIPVAGDDEKQFSQSVITQIQVRF
ncbi:MAG: DUF3943 domain-containing protein [Candidatus Dadabacteria bacterium]|nr:DUF3943 domain-containing protein [Candidatus Dadabacteria bacterium]